MVEIAAKFGWNYVITLADDGNYGEKGVSAFEEKAKKYGIMFDDYFNLYGCGFFVNVETIGNNT